ncbi:MAG TPA: peptidylprolyl isomerase [Candidatus Hydrogenedentes bacterium]|nr:peptidylprolyl isomerase [Candidatus Hydrogenedentota bacterium]HPU98313.1 peptidylprolyl isomerase [Candidatus Hydrogenedentota bacterium]
MKTRKLGWISINLTVLVVILAGGMACGRLVDKDRIRVAKIGDKYITRGDLFRLLREMPDDERPAIRNRGDLLRLLNQHIDERIKIPLGRQMEQEGKISVPFEVALEAFFASKQPDEEAFLRNMWAMEVPKDGQMTPLMKIYDMTPERLQFQKDFIRDEAERLRAKMLGDAAVEFLAAEAYRAGQLAVDEDTLRQEYRIQQTSLKIPEKVRFQAIRFDAAQPDASEQAMALRQRLDSGESFDQLFETYRQQPEAEAKLQVLEIEFVHGPDGEERFRGVWEHLSGSEPGQVIGPIFLPDFARLVQQNGRRQRQIVPAGYVVLKVLEYQPEQDMPFEMARPILLRPILIAKMMDKLRQERGVEVYDDALPDVGQAMGSQPVGL